MILCKCYQKHLGQLGLDTLETSLKVPIFDNFWIFSRCLKLGQCLNIDNMTSLSKFSEVT